MEKIIVAGSRSFNDYGFMCKRLREYLTVNNDGDWTIISGHAKGADSLGETFAKEHGLKLEIFHADWNKYGKSAGYIRNEKMAKNADTLIAFWDGKSKGTKHMIDIALDKGLEVHVVRF